MSLSLSGVGGKGGKKKKTKAASKPSKANGSNWANVPLPPPPVHPLPGTEIDHYPNELHEGGGYVCLECRDIVERGNVPRDRNRSNITCIHLRSVQNKQQHFRLNKTQNDSGKKSLISLLLPPAHTHRWSQIKLFAVFQSGGKHITALFHKEEGQTEC